jgi:hyaluronate lyase
MRFATFWLDHGKGLNNGSYAYAILPGRTANELQAYASKPQVQIISNTPEAQVLTAPSKGLTGIVGWSAGTVANVSFSQALLILIQETPTKLSVALCDPTMKLTAPVTITLPQNVKSVAVPNERIRVVSTSPLTLEFEPEGANGQSMVLETNR